VLPWVLTKAFELFSANNGYKITTYSLLITTNLKEIWYFSFRRLFLPISVYNSNVLRKNLRSKDRIVENLNRTSIALLNGVLLLESIHRIHSFVVVRHLVAIKYDWLIQSWSHGRHKRHIILCTLNLRHLINFSK